MRTDTFKSFYGSCDRNGWSDNTISKQSARTDNGNDVNPRFFCGGVKGKKTEATPPPFLGAGGSPHTTPPI